MGWSFRAELGSVWGFCLLYNYTCSFFFSLKSAENCCLFAYSNEMPVTGEAASLHFLSLLIKCKNLPSRQGSQSQICLWIANPDPSMEFSLPPNWIHQSTMRIWIPADGFTASLGGMCLRVPGENVEFFGEHIEEDQAPEWIKWLMAHCCRKCDTKQQSEQHFDSKKTPCLTGEGAEAYIIHEPPSLHWKYEVNSYHINRYADTEGEKWRFIYTTSWQ